jgi:hypothetical protein
MKGVKSGSWKLGACPVRVALIATLALSGCSALQGSGLTKEDAVDIAVLAAFPACDQLEKSLKPDEVAKLATALAIVQGLLSKDPSQAEQIINGLILMTPSTQPYAPAIARMVNIGIRRIPEESRDSLYGQAALGIVSSCLAALPATA